MTIKELINQLKIFDENAEIGFYFKEIDKELNLANIRRFTDLDEDNENIVWFDLTGR